MVMTAVSAIGAIFTEEMDIAQVQFFDPLNVALVIFDGWINALTVAIPGDNC
jgi:hypothetical protein